MNKSTTWRFIGNTLLPALVLFTFIGCGGGESDDVTEAILSDPVADQYKADAINIASITNLSSVRNGVLLGEKHVNEAGGVLGKEFNVVAFVAGSTEESVILAGKILENDIQIINVSYSSRSKAVSELTIPREVVLISESATSPFFTDYEDNDFYFRLTPSDVHQGRVLAQVAINSGAQTAVTVFNEGDQYGDTLTSEFKVNFEELGGTELDRIAVPFSVEVGFDTYLNQVAASSPDAIINTILEASIAANFVNESAAFNLSSLFIMPDTSAGVSGFVNSIANFDFVDGALGTSPGFGLESQPEMAFFSNSYQAQYGSLPEGFNVNAYDYAIISALAIERAGLVNNTTTPTGRQIRDSMRDVMNPPGIIVTPSNLAAGLQMVRNGEDVDFTGAYGANDWDVNGDISGEITFDVLRVDGATGTWVTDQQEQVFVPFDDGSG
jgi:branched-chain amino acid transport system substrate-binding protein